MGDTLEPSVSPMVGLAPKTSKLIVFKPSGANMDMKNGFGVSFCIGLHVSESQKLRRWPIWWPRPYVGGGRLPPSPPFNVHVCGHNKMSTTARAHYLHPTTRLAHTTRLAPTTRLASDYKTCILLQDLHPTTILVSYYKTSIQPP